MRVDAEPAFVLHTRPYRETSQLVDLLTPGHGRIRVIGRGTRRRKQGAATAPFAPLSVSWGGRSDLKTLYSAEADGAPALLQGERLFTGLYLNELLLRLLPEQDPQEQIYRRYAQLLLALAGAEPLEPLLRCFEFALLEELGYGLVFEVATDSGDPIDRNREYLYSPEGGFCACYDRRSADHRLLFDGAELLAMAQGDYRREPVRRSAKRLSRLALQPLIGNAPLRSRALFQRPIAKESL